MRNLDLKNILKNRNFTLLWLDQILSNVSYNFVNFALMVWVYQLTKSNFAVALLILTMIVPTALLSVFTGVVSDFFDRRKIMFITDFLYATLVLGFILIHDNVLVILTLSFIINCVDRFFNPAEQASLPNVVSESDLLLANSLFSISANLTFTLGFSLAGPAMLFIGNKSPFIIAAFSTYLAALCVYFLPAIRTSQEKTLALKTILDDTLEVVKTGYHFILDKRIITTAIIFVTMIQVVINIGASLGPGYAEGTLGLDVRHASLIFALPIGLGSLVAIYLMNRWNKKILKREIVQRGLLLATISLIILGCGPIISDFLLPRAHHFKLIRPLSHLVSLSGLTFMSTFLMGMMVTFVSVPTTTILSENTPPELRGRVWGVANMFQNAVAALPLLFIGAIADRISVLPLTFVFAILSLLAYNLTKKKTLGSFFYG